MGVVASAAGAGLAVVIIGPFLALLERARLVPSGSAVDLPWWPLPAGAGVGLIVAVLAVRSASRRASKVLAARGAPDGRGREACDDARPVGRRPRRHGRRGGARGGKGDGQRRQCGHRRDARGHGVGARADPARTGHHRPARLAGHATVEWAHGGAVWRVASTAAPVIATVGFSVLMAGTYATVHAFDLREEAQALPAEVVVVSDGTPGLSDAAAAVPAGVPASLGTTLFATDAAGQLRALAADGIDAAAPTREITVRAGSLDNLRGDTVAVAGSDAANLGWQVGTEALVTFVDGRRVALRVVAMLADESVPGEVMLARYTVRQHDQSALVEAVYVDGQTPGSLNGRLAGLGATAVRAEAYVDARSADEWRLVRLSFALLIAMSVGYTAIAIANTLMMATADRRREFATLRLAGAGVEHVLRVVAAEAALVVGLGTGLGMMAAWTALVGIVSGLRDYIPDTQIVLPWPVVVAVVGICLLLALVASVVPARLVLRTPTAALAREYES